VYLRVDPDTLEVVGYEILDFRKQYAASRLLQKAFGKLHEAILRYQVLTLPPESPASRQAAADIVIEAAV
jgi:hypothetical protein